MKEKRKRGATMEDGTKFFLRLEKTTYEGLSRKYGGNEDRERT